MVEIYGWVKVYKMDDMHMCYIDESLVLWW